MLNESLFSLFWKELSFSLSFFIDLSTEIVFNNSFGKISEFNFLNLSSNFLKYKYEKTFQYSYKNGLEDLIGTSLWILYELFCEFSFINLITTLYDDVNAYISVVSGSSFSLKKL